MRTFTRYLLGVIVVLLAATVATASAQPADPDRDPMADLVLSAADLAAAVETDTILQGESLLPTTPDGPTASFTTETIEAPIPFNAVVPQWTGEVGEAIELRVRTSGDGRAWGEWLAVHANFDWMEPGEAEIVGEMVLVPDAGVTHRFVQVQVLFNAVNEVTGEPFEGTPSLQELRLTFIDTTSGPTAEQLVDLQQQLDEQQGVLPERADGYPKPFVISRGAWCNHARCNYSDGLEYHPVSHLIVHHTVSNNSSSDWPAVVRAIWNFHTFSRGWGDIGYNYLIDPNGVIYEGHNGGDNVVGTHASGANKGSMAAALLGTFTAPNQSPPGIRPPQPMLNSLVELLSWKADQRDINIFDASATLPNLNWGLPHLMGHRDVYGTTVCPGDQAHLLIPWLRDQIAARIGLVDPFLYADENTTAFTRSSTGEWRVPPYLCGFNNHAWYSWSVNSAGSSQVWGEWRPNVPSAGRYRIDVHIPYCHTGRNETGSATYTIQSADGTATRTISQQANVGRWVTLGEFNLRQGNSNVIRLTDLTRDSGFGVWFDAVRLLPLGGPPPPPPPTATNIDPSANLWRRDRAVTFAWQVANPETVWYTTLQVATDPAFLNVLINQSWWGVATSHSHRFDRDYPALYWRVLLSRENAPLISSQPTRFGLDATAPQSAVARPLYFVPGGGFYRLVWSGDDATAGIDRYHIDVRPVGGAWTRWLSDTRLTSANFRAPSATTVYEFRAQAVDGAGNVEAPAAADVTSATAVRLNRSFVAPIVAR